MIVSVVLNKIILSSTITSRANMSKIVETAEKYRINIYRGGVLDGIQDDVKPEDVFKISAQLKTAEDKGGRTDSVVEFEPVKSESKPWFRFW